MAVTTKHYCGAWASTGTHSMPSPQTQKHLLHSKIITLCFLQHLLHMQLACRPHHPCSRCCCCCLLLLLLPPQLRILNCFEDILQVICKADPQQQAQASGLLPVLSSAAERCINYQPPASVTCPDGRVLTTVSPASLLEPMAADMAIAEPPMPEVAAPMAEMTMPEVAAPAAGAPEPEVLVVPAVIVPAVAAPNATNTSVALP